MDDWLPVVFAFVLGLSFILLDGRVPLDRRADEGDHDEPALRRRGLRADGAGLPGGRRHRPVRASSRWTRSRRGYRCSCSPCSSGSRWTTTCSCSAASASATTQTRRQRARPVAFGVRSTARIITGAALIMVVVFAGFALGDLVMFQQMGFGLAVARAPRRDGRPLGAGARRDGAARRPQLVPAPVARVAAALRGGEAETKS